MSPDLQLRTNEPLANPTPEQCHREAFHDALPLLLRGEDSEFQSYLRRISKEERGALYPLNPPS